MTNLPEAKLAREAELCYATVALATDFDCWHEDEDDVSVEGVLETLRKNVARASELVAELARSWTGERSCACKDALSHAIMTAPDAITAEARARLDLLIGRHLG